MAIEVLKSAALTYQGSSSSAGKPTKSKESTSVSDTEARKPALSSTDAGEKPIQPIKDDSSGQSGFSGEISSGQQTSKQLQQAVDKLKKNLMAQTEAVFGIHEGTNRVMIKIVDKETKDIIKEYPPEQTLDMIQKVWEMAGIMVDEKR